MANPIFGIQYSDQGVRDRLLALQRKIGDLTPAMKNIGEYLVLATDDRFRNETDPAGNKWQPNSPRTIAIKRAEGRILRVLQSTGRLRSSIVARAESDRVIVGTNVSYAAKHQLGQGVPQREFLGVNKQDLKEIAIILQEYLALP